MWVISSALQLVERGARVRLWVSSDRLAGLLQRCFAIFAIRLVLVHSYEYTQTLTITHLDPQSGGGMPSGGVSSAGSAELSAPAARGVAPVGGVSKDQRVQPGVVGLSTAVLPI